MTPEALPEVAKVAAEVRGYARLTTSFLLLGDRLVEERRLLDAAFCYRAAEFFLLPSDERRAPARQRFVNLVRQAYGILPPHNPTRLTVLAFPSQAQGSAPAIPDLGAR